METNNNSQITCVPTILEVIIPEQEDGGAEQYAAGTCKIKFLVRYFIKLYCLLVYFCWFFLRRLYSFKLCRGKLNSQRGIPFLLLDFSDKICLNRFQMNPNDNKVIVRKSCLGNEKCWKESE